MSYYFNKLLNISFDDALIAVTEGLAKEGFGILTEIDVQATMNKKLNVVFRKYRILGACSPSHAFRALSAEDKIGTMLPCSVIVQELGENLVEAAAVDPVASMQAVQNSSLGVIAHEIREKLKKVIESL